MPGHRSRRYHLADFLGPEAWFYLERQQIVFPGPTGAASTGHGWPELPVRHRHDYLELFWVVSGRGCEHRDDGVHPLDAGSLVLLRPDDAHGFSGFPSDSLVIWNLAFPEADWRILLTRHAGELRDWFDLPPAERRLRLRPQELDRLKGWAEDLAARHRRRRLDLHRLLLDLDHLLDSGLHADAGTVPAWLAEAVAAVRQPCWFVLGPQALVRLCHRSGEHVARCVRRHLGTTPTALVNEARLAWAAERLAGSDDAILTICLDCGWQSLGCFYRSFRRRFGTTPNEWRRRARRIVGGHDLGEERQEVS